jgi:hypothetical protein
MKKAFKIVIVALLVSFSLGTVVLAVDKKEKKEKLSYNEYKELIELYDHEIKKTKGATLNNVNEENIYDRLEEEIDKRDVKEDKINYGTKDLTKEEYGAKKDDLFAKRKNSKLTK